jgi:hypothetical protein
LLIYDMVFSLFPMTKLHNIRFFLFLLRHRKKIYEQLVNSMTKKNHSLIFVSCIPFLLFFLKGKIFFPIEKFSSYPNSKNYQHWYKKERKQSIPIKIEERQRNLKYADEKDVFFLQKYTSKHHSSPYNTL